MASAIPRKRRIVDSVLLTFASGYAAFQTLAL